MNFPDKFDVITVHAQLIAVTGGSQGLRDEGALESALAAPQNRLYYEEASLIICAATYAYHITQAHAFIDGNKRVAAAITETFLETNGAQLNLSNEEIVSNLSWHKCFTFCLYPYNTDGDCLTILVAQIINRVPSVILTQHQLKPSTLRLNYPQPR